MAEFHRIGSLSEIPDPGKACFEVEDRIVVVIHSEGKLTCLDDICTHDGGPLAEGKLEGETLSCPRHGAQFDINNGRALTLPATQPTAVHDVKIEGDAVFVRIYEEGKDMSEEKKEPEAKQEPETKQGEASAGHTEANTETQKDNAPKELQETAGDTESKSLNEDLVREALKKVIDPELFVNIVDLGLIYGVMFEAVDEKTFNVKIAMTMTSPACPAGPQLIAGAQNAVGQIPDVAEVEVQIVMDPPWTPDCMTEDARDQLGIF